MSRRSKHWNNGWVVRPLALADLVFQTCLLPVYVICYGVPIIWQDWWTSQRSSAKALKTGRAGPYQGIFW